MSSRNCKIHKNQCSSYICTFQECGIVSRWACVECLAQYIHRHNQPSNIHIMNQSQLSQLLSQKFTDNSEETNQLQQEIQQYIQQIWKLLKLVNKIYQFLENCQKEILDYQLVLNIQQKVDKDFFSINSNQICKVLNQSIRIKQYYDQEFLQNIKQITNLLQEIEQQVIKNSQSKQQTLINYNYNYDFHDSIKLSQKYYICAAQISQNEQYLVFGGQEKLLVIYDLNLNKEINTIKLDQQINVCQFSNDSKLIYVGCQNGYLYCIKMTHNQAKIKKQQLYKVGIYNIIQQSTQVIFTSHETDIVITNIKLNKQLFQIQNAGKKTNQLKSLNYFIISLEKQLTVMKRIQFMK